MDEKCDQGKDMGIGFQVYTPYVELGYGSEGNWSFFLESEAALQRRSWQNVFCKYAVNLQENTHAEVWFQ